MKVGTLVYTMFLKLVISFLMAVVVGICLFIATTSLMSGDLSLALLFFLLGLVFLT